VLGNGTLWTLLKRHDDKQTPLAVYVAGVRELYILVTQRCREMYPVIVLRPDFVFAAKRT